MNYQNKLTNWRKSTVFFLLMLALFTKLEGKENQKPMVNRPTVVMETTQGTIEIALMPDIAPKATENFLKLAEKNYYDGLTFHRVIKDFMVQGGDPTGTGAGGESIWGSPFEDEFDVDVTFDRPGLLAMANAGPHTNGSQFFITTIATPWLSGRHTIFGEVVKGQDIVKKIENVETGPMDKPSTPQQILKITVKNAEAKA